MGKSEILAVSPPISGTTPRQEAASPLPKSSQVKNILPLTDQLHNAVQKLQKQKESELSTAVGAAIDKVKATQKIENIYPPTFEDVLADIDPEDLKVWKKIKEKAETLP